MTPMDPTVRGASTNAPRFRKVVFISWIAPNWPNGRRATSQGNTPARR